MTNQQSETPRTTAAIRRGSNLVKECKDVERELAAKEKELAELRRDVARAVWEKNWFEPYALNPQTGVRLGLEADLEQLGITPELLEEGE